MTLKNYEQVFIHTDFSRLSPNIPVESLTVILAVFFKQLAQQKHDYIKEPLLSTILEFEMNDSGYNSHFEQVPKMFASSYFNHLIQQNISLSVIHHNLPKLRLRHEYTYDNQLGKIENIKDAFDFVCDITEDDYFNSEVEEAFTMGLELRAIMLEKESLEREIQKNNIKPNQKTKI